VRLDQRGPTSDAQKDQVMAESIESPSHPKSEPRPDVEPPRKEALHQKQNYALGSRDWPFLRHSPQVQMPTHSLAQGKETEGSNPATSSKRTR
jgi:hypothetical protein